MKSLVPLTLLCVTQATGCFSERLAPPSFRSECSGNSDCGAGESCINDLCQVGCTVATQEQDCGPLGQTAFVACINGVCVSACELDDGPCSGEQACTDVPGLSDMLGSGLCIEACVPESCPAGETCIEGLCVPRCDPAAESCSPGFTCVAGVCLPEDGLDPTGGDPTRTSGTGEGDGA